MGPLVDANELRALLDHPDVRVCDVRWYLDAPGRGRKEYATGHVPGAVFVDLDDDLSGDEGPGRHPLPGTPEFAETLGRLGITPDHRVVAYDSAAGAVAARMWWMLRSIGHRRAQVLDGGFREWAARGLPLETGIPSPAPATYPVPDAWTGVEDLEAVRARGGRPLVDARAPERYRGDVEPIDSRPGHIPGALNIPHGGNVDSTGRFHDPATLSGRFAKVPSRPIVYCGSGVTACSDILAMELAGRTDATLYVGSWSDWSSHPDLPADLGPG